MSVTNILKQLREERHDSQEDVAIATGLCSRTVGRIECGERNPSLEMAIHELFSLYNLLEKSVILVTTGSNGPTEPVAFILSPETIH